MSRSRCSASWKSWTPFSRKRPVCFPLASVRLSPCLRVCLYYFESWLPNGSSMSIRHSCRVKHLLCSRPDFHRTGLTRPLPTTAGVDRTVLKPIHFQDGTSLPAGTHIGAAGYCIARDPDFFEEPLQFDPYRHVRHHGDQKSHFITTSAQNLLFGHGRHACPGRFFAVAEMKVVMAEVVRRYDVRLIPGTVPRRGVFGLATIPETKLKILMRVAGSRTSKTSQGSPEPEHNNDK
jgi:hypothetical protein